MRLILDAHISGPRIAKALRDAGPLRDAGHEVRAADEERELDGATDEELLSLAAAEGRIFVTFDVKDFPVIARRWAESGREHAGCAIVVGIGQGEFGAVLDAVGRQLKARPDRDDWKNYTLFIARSAN